MRQQRTHRVPKKKRPGRKPKSQEPGGGPATLLQKWLDANGFASADLERATGIYRQSMKRVREGTGGVTKATMIRILLGARHLAGQHVQITDLFSFELDSPEN